MSDDNQQPPAENERPHRAIKSFVMRSGRMTEGQQRGLDQGWPKFGLEPAAGLQDFDQLFGRKAPRTFEIGFGMGQATLEMAAAAPGEDFIGVEVHRPGVGALLNGMLTQNLSNIRVYSWDAIEVLRDCVADNSLDRLLLFFPDPWHKARHHKRRIVQPAWAQLVRQKLKVGGVLHMATAWLPQSGRGWPLCSASGGKAGDQVRAPWRTAWSWRVGSEIPAYRLRLIDPARLTCAGGVKHRDYGRSQLAGDSLREEHRQQAGSYANRIYRP